MILERGEGREKEKERNIDVKEKHSSVASHTHPDRDQAQNPGMCPDWELNQRPFGLCDDAQPTKPPQAGLINKIFIMKYFWPWPGNSFG